MVRRWTEFDTILRIGGAFLLALLLLALTCQARPPVSLIEVDLSGDAGSSQVISQTIPAGAYALRFSIVQGTGDADLYVAFARQPDATDYDCASTNAGEASEYCILDASAHPEGGIYYVEIAGITEFEGATLITKYQPAAPPVCGNGVSEAGEQCDDGNTEDGDGCNATCVDERSWGLPVPLDNGEFEGFEEPRVAADAQGNATVVWSQKDGTRSDIWANRFSPEDGWGTPQLLETSTERASWPDAAAGPEGSAIIVWEQYNFGYDAVWASRFTPEDGWGTPEIIGEGIRARIAIDGEGGAIVVWRKLASGFPLKYSIWANRRTPQEGWGTPQRVSSEEPLVNMPRVVVDRLGNAIAIWAQDVDGLYKIWANHFTPQGGWGVPAQLDTESAGTSSRASAAFDPDGNAVVVWAEHDGIRNNIRAVRFTPQGGWSTPELVENEDKSALSPEVTFDANGNGIVVWTLHEINQADVWATRFTLQSDWETRDLLDTGSDGVKPTPQVAVDANGNAVVAWVRWDNGNADIWGIRFTPQAGWGTAEILGNEVGPALPNVATHPNGNSIVVWNHGPSESIRATRFE